MYVCVSYCLSMDCLRQVALIIILVFLTVIVTTFACSNGQCKLQDKCSSDGDCATGLYCFSCDTEQCVRSTITDQFKLLNNSLPFNKYAFLTTHNSYAITGDTTGTLLTLTNQEDSITQQLNNGVRGLMLDTYDFKGDIWLCHSFGEVCLDNTAFGPALDTFKEIEAFLAANPSEIVTLILEDFVETPNGLTKVFNASGLNKYWFPVSNMPKEGQDWPPVKDMVADNQRLVVFTSNQSKQESEGIAYQWNYMVENQHGDDGVKLRKCTNRKESAPLDDKTKSLVFVNHFPSIPVKAGICEINSEIIESLHTCYVAAGNRWANFVAVDYYKRSNGGGAFQAVDTLNGELLCNSDDVHACALPLHNTTQASIATHSGSASVVFYFLTFVFGLWLLCI